MIFMGFNVTKCGIVRCNCSVCLILHVGLFSRYDLIMCLLSVNMEI